MALVLPYKVIDVEHYEKYYDNISIPVKTHPKSAIVERNKWMVDNSDIVLVYVEKNLRRRMQSYEVCRKIRQKGDKPRKC